MGKVLKPDYAALLVFAGLVAWYHLRRPSPASRDRHVAESHAYELARQVIGRAKASATAAGEGA